MFDVVRAMSSIFGKMMHLQKQTREPFVRPLWVGPHDNTHVCILTWAQHAHKLSVPLPQGRTAAWLEACVGVDPANLYPSVRCGLEGALFTALAQAHSLPLSSLLLSSHAVSAQLHTECGQQDKVLLVNALLDCSNSTEGCVAQACRLVSQGYTALKLKASKHDSWMQL